MSVNLTVRYEICFANETCFLGCAHVFVCVCEREITHHLTLLWMTAQEEQRHYKYSLTFTLGSFISYNSAQGTYKYKYMLYIWMT